MSYFLRNLLCLLMIVGGIAGLWYGGSSSRDVPPMLPPIRAEEIQHLREAAAIRNGDGLITSKLEFAADSPV